MKLVVQIPCHNEEDSLPRTLAGLPRSVPGFDSVEWLLVDDGSLDRSVEVARDHGIDHVLSLAGRRGLAAAFLAGLEESLGLGADVVVSTDADNQYRGEDIPRLVQPILDGRADMVVGERPIDEMSFSWLKKRLQRLGSWVVRRVSGADVPDATSGFRAYSRDAALRINVFSSFSYTLEVLIQLGLSGARIATVPIGVHTVTRPSRLFRSTPEFVLRQAMTIFRIYAIYRPFELFATPGLLLLLLGLLTGLRFLVFLAVGDGQGHVQSLILGSILISTGFLLLLAALLANLLAANRTMLEDLRSRTRRLEHSRSPGPAPPQEGRQPRDLPSGAAPRSSTKTSPSS